MSKLLKRIITSLYLFILTCPALTWAQIDAFDAGAVNNRTDASVNYLSQIFGNVGHVLSSTSGQFLGAMFKVFNTGILAVSGVWVLYSVFNTLIKISSKNAEQHTAGLAMKFLKIVVGIILVVPSPVTGYSLIQDIVMKVVVEGIKLADTTWSAALDYLGDGGTLLDTSAGSGSGQKGDSLETISKQQGYFGGPNDPTPFAGNIMEVFAAEVNAIKRSGSKKNLQTYEVGGYNGTTCMKIGDAPSDGKPCIIFTTGEHNSGSISTELKINKKPADDNGDTLTALADDLQPAANYYACVLSSPTDNGNWKDYCAMIGLKTTTLNNETIATSSQFYTYLSNAFIAYYGRILPLARKLAMGGDTKVGGNYGIGVLAGDKAGHNDGKTVANTEKDVIQVMKQSGWINAGAYYWATAEWLQNNSQFGSIDGTSNVEEKALSYAKGATIAQTSAMRNISDDSEKSELATGIQKKLYPILASYSKALGLKDHGDGTKMQNSCTGSASCDNVIVGMILHIILPIYDTMLSSLSDLGHGLHSADPIVIMATVGHNLIKVATSMLIGGLTLFSVAAAAAMAVGNIMPVGMGGSIVVNNFIMPIAKLIFSLLQSLAMYFILVGGTASIFLPLYPWVLWTFAVLGWFIAVIETMCAAPLICLGLTKPKGQEFATDIEQAIMLLLSVFLRPALMVLGLCAAILLTRVAITYLTHGLAILAYNMYVDPKDAAGSIAKLGNDGQSIDYINALLLLATNFSTGGNAQGINSADAISDIVFVLIAIPTIYGIIAYISYNIVTQTYSLVFHLPQYVMRWIGGGAAGDTQGMIGKVEGAKGGAQAGLKGAQAGTAGLSSLGAGFTKGSGSLSKIASGGEDSESEDSESGEGDSSAGSAG